MSKLISIEQAAELIKDGDTLAVGGFMANGSPEHIIDAFVAKGVKDLTLICNDAGFPDRGVGKMVAGKQFKKILASHIGLNKEAGRQMNEGETEIDLIPQGTLIERIRCGACGLGGVLTPTGIGTLVEEGKQRITVDGRDYLLETPLKADVAIVYADLADEAGNLIYKGSENNFNHWMAGAAKVTIVEAKKIVPVGELDPNQIYTPGVFVNYLVQGE